MSRPKGKRIAYQPLYDGVDASQEAASRSARVRKKDYQERDGVTVIRKKDTERSEGDHEASGKENTVSAPEEQPAVSGSQRMIERTHRAVVSEPVADPWPPPADVAGPLVSILYVAANLRTAGPFTGYDKLWPDVAMAAMADVMAGPWSPEVEASGATMMHRLTPGRWQSMAPQLATLHEVCRPGGSRPNADDYARLMDRTEVILDYVAAMGWPSSL